MVDGSVSVELNFFFFFYLFEMVFDVGEELLVLGFVKLGFTDMSKKDVIFVNWYLFNFDLE